MRLASIGTPICLLLSVVLSLTIAACGTGPDQSREDAFDTRNVDKTAPQVVAFNNNYPNVETKCALGTGFRVFVLTHGSATGRNFEIVADPTCGGTR